jgi:Uri superfamily endonuclease
MNLNCEQNDYQVLEHLKDKNIKEGVYVYVQAGLAQKTLCHQLSRFLLLVQQA